MTDTMREAFEDHAYYWARSLTVVDGEYCDDEVNSAWLYFKAGAAWQAAQSVPVVGEPVAYVRKDQLQHVNTFGPALCHVYATEQNGTIALYEKPTTSTTAQELDALRRCKELLAEARDDVAEQLSHMLSLAGYPSNDRRISQQRELLDAIDAAMQERNK